MKVQGPRFYPPPPPHRFPKGLNESPKLLSLGKLPVFMHYWFTTCNYAYYVKGLGIMQNIKSLALRMFWTPIYWDVHVFPIHIKYETEFNYFFFCTNCYKRRGMVWALSSNLLVMSSNPFFISLTFPNSFKTFFGQTL